MSRSLRCFALLLLTLLTPVFYAQTHQAAGDDKDLIELQHYTLTMDKVTRFMQTNADFTKLAKANPQMAQKNDSDSDKDQSLADMEKRISAEPQLAAVLKQNGFTPREFVLCEMTVFQSAFAAYAKQSGADPAKLASDAHVNPANITFMEQHKAEFEELQKKYGPKQDEGGETKDGTDQ